MYNNPVIALEKMEEGFDQLMNAVKIANETMETSTFKAREASARLAEMTAELSPVAQGLHESRTDKNDSQRVESDENIIEGEVISKEVEK